MRKLWWLLLFALLVAPTAWAAPAPSASPSEETTAETTKAPAPDIAGQWEWTHRILLLPRHAAVTVKPDGTIWDAKGTMLGTWECTDAKERAFIMHWTNGDDDHMTLSKDGRKFTGLNPNGIPISANKK